MGHRAFPRGLLEHASMKVLIQREKAVGLEFPEDTAEFLLNPVNGMEKVAAVDLEHARAELPVGAEQEVVLEQLVLEIIQCSPADVAEIGDVLFVLAPPVPLAFPSWNDFQRDSAHVLGLRDTMAKPRVTGAEDGPQHAVARVHLLSGAGPQPQAMALGAGIPGQRNRV